MKNKVGSFAKLSQSNIDKNGPIIYPKLGRCWIWIGSHSSKGYGPHRKMWSEHNGHIPKGHYICHKCDNRRCVRLSHLFLGTPTDNVQDMLRKGRNTPGDGGWNNPNAENRRKELKKRATGNKYALGYKHSHEAKKKMSLARIGNKNGLGYKHTPEAKAKISKTHLGSKRSEATKKKMREAWRNRKLKS